jgi:hypothetical protein
MQHDLPSKEALSESRFKKILLHLSVFQVFWALDNHWCKSKKCTWSQFTYKKKVKGLVHPRSGHADPEGGWDIALLFLKLLH